MKNDAGSDKTQFERAYMRWIVLQVDESDMDEDGGVVLSIGRGTKERGMRGGMGGGDATHLTP